MKKKILAGIALAVILAMESVTVFATEGLSATSDVVNDILFGGGGSDDSSDEGSGDSTDTSADTTTGVTTPGTNNMGYLYGDASNAVVDNTLNDVVAEDIAKNVDVEINSQTGDVESKHTGMIFHQDNLMDLRLIDKGDLKGDKNVDLTIDIRVDDTDKSKKTPLTNKDTTYSVAVTEKAIEYGRQANSNLVCSYTVSVIGGSDDSNRHDGNGSNQIDINDIEFKGEGLKNVREDCATCIHVTDWGVTENLGVVKTAEGFRPARNPSSYSPFILLVFDNPVPGLTTGVDYSEAPAINTDTSDQGTLAGATSPKTAQTYPYAVATAAVALSCVYACTKKIVKR